MCVMPAMAPAVEDNSFLACTEQTATQGRISSKYRGLCWDKKHRAWRVRIFYCGKQRHVGRYRDADTAARAYDKAAMYLYGANAILNFSMEECLADPSEVSGFITLAKEQAMQQQQQLQQSQQYVADQLRPASSHSMLQGRCYVADNNKYQQQQMALLAAQRAVSPAVLPTMQQQQQQYLVQAVGAQLPVMHQSQQPPQLQQKQQQLATWSAGDHTTNSNTWLLLQQQQQQQALAVANSQLANQQQTDAYFGGNMQSLDVMMPMQSVSTVAAVSNGIALQNPPGILNASSSIGSSSSNNGCVVVMAPPALNITASACMPGHLVSFGNTNTGSTSPACVPGHMLSAHDNSSAGQYITTADGQHALLPVQSTASSTVHVLHHSGSAGHPLLAPLQQQQQQHLGSACTPFNTTSSSKSSAAQSSVILPQQANHPLQQQQQQIAPLVHQLSVSSSNKGPPMCSPNVSLLQQVQIAAPAASAAAVSSSDAASLLTLMQNCSISQCL